MKKLFEKIAKTEEELSLEKGQFYLFVIFETPGLHNSWDILASAPWLPTGSKGIRLLVNKLQEHLTIEENRLISKVVVLENDNPIVEELTDLYDIEHELLRVYPLYLESHQFDRAIIITAKPLPQEQAA